MHQGTDGRGAGLPHEGRGGRHVMMASAVRQAIAGTLVLALGGCSKQEAAPASTASAPASAVAQAEAPTGARAKGDEARARRPFEQPAAEPPPPMATMLPKTAPGAGGDKRGGNDPNDGAPAKSGRKDRDLGLFDGEGGEVEKKKKEAKLTTPMAPPAAKGPAGGLGGLGAVGGAGKPALQQPIGGVLADGKHHDDSAAKQAAQATIDPNGRFATTYRPGGGHLAAFDSAIARGIVTEEERELVSDLGARYSPDFAIPPQKTLWAKNELERAKLPPAGGPVHLRVALKSADVAPAARPHLSVHLVLDVSGSMQGESIDNARKAAAALVDKLAPGDDFSLVTFSNEAQVLVPDGPVGARRASIKTTIAAIKEGGGTNIGDGLILGYKEAAKPTIPADAVKVVLLLSDGRANSGILDQGRLSTLALNAFQDGVQTSTFGLGGDFDGALMSSIANDGAGGYYYLRDAQQIAPALATELDKRLDPVATALEVRVRLKPGVQLLDVYGSRRLSESEEVRVRVQEIAADVQAEKKGIKRDRQDDQKGGMRFFLPGFARNDSHAILLKLNVPEGVGERDVALVELKYKDRVKKTNVQEELVVKTSFATSDADSAATIDGSVARSVQGFSAGETLAQSARLISNGSQDSAVALLAEREGILRRMAETMNEPLFLKDADRVARLRARAGAVPGAGPNDPLVLAMLLETASNAHRR